jgi:tetratricopeptide (TPR) repeat protein/TolB-like protein
VALEYQVVSRRGRSSALLIAAALFPAALAAQTPEPEPCAPSGTCLKVSVSNFRNIAASSRLNGLATALPAAMRIGLLQFHWLNVSSGRPGPWPESYPGGKAAQSNAPAESGKPDYWIDGSFAELQNRIRLSVNVRSVKEESIVYADSMVASEDNLLATVALLSSRVAEMLRRKLPAPDVGRPVSVLIGVPMQVAGKNAGMDSLARWLPETIAEFLVQSKVENASFQAGDPQQRTDILVTGTLSLEQDQYVLTMTAREQTPVVTFRTSLRKDFIATAPERVAKQIADIVRARTGRQGGLRTETISFTAGTAAGYLNEARRSRQNGEPYRAILMYRKAIETGPLFAEPHFALADIYQSQKEFDCAAAQYEEVLRISPGNPAAEEGLGTAALGKKDYAGAIRHFRAAVNLTPADSPLRANLFKEMGDAAALSGSQDDAVDSYRQAVEFAPGNPLFYRVLSQALVAAGKFGEASDALNEAMARFPSDASVKVELSRVYLREVGDAMQKQDYNAALDVLNRMLALHVPVGYEGYEDVWIVYRALGREKDGVAVLAGQLKENPRDSYLMLKLAQIYHDQLGEYEKAYQVNRARFDLIPDDTTAAGNLAESCLATNRLAEALSLADKVLATQNLDVEERLTARLITISALLLQRKPAEAYSQVGEFIGYYNSLPADYPRDWTFTGTKRFITRQKLPDTDKQTILSLIDILESPKAEAAKKVNLLAAALPKRLGQHQGDARQ